MTKTLLSLGDSWSDHDYPSYTENDIKIWDVRLAEKLGYRLINRGKEASSNEKILKMGIDYLSQNEPPDLICVIWSEQHRFDFYNCLRLIPITLYFAGDPKRPWLRSGDQREKLINTDIWYEKLFHEGIDQYAPDDFFRNMWTLQYIADTMNVPIYHACGTAPWTDWLYEDHKIEDDDERKSFAKNGWRKFSQKWLESPYFDYFDKKSNVIGWPLLDSLGGAALSKVQEKKGWVISDTDRHPNNDGMEFVANAFLEKIKI
jgi:hypothetical protein